MRHRGVCRGARFGSILHRLPPGFANERAKIIARRDRLREEIRKQQAELLAIDAKLEALKVMEAAYLPDPKPASQFALGSHSGPIAVTAVSNQPAVGRSASGNATEWRAGRSAR